LGLYFLKVKPHEAVTKTPGTYVYFKGGIVFKQAEGLNKKEAGCLSGRTFNPAALKQLGLCLHNGTIKLFWGKKEITKGLGFYSSFCCAGLWCDSSQAIWAEQDSSAAGTTLIGTWPWLPLIQSWQISLAGRKIILDIETEVYREFYLDCEEVNLFLSPDYRSWFAGRRRGPFYNEFSQGDLFRFRIWISRKAGERLGAGARWFSLPAVSLRPLSVAPDAYLVIENANILGEKGRLIQYLRLPDKEQALVKPGRYHSFKGAIEIARF
jgi:hypothetical protein